MSFNKVFHTVLYVDDEQQNLVSFGAAFRRIFDVITAQSAAEALEIMEKKSIHILVTDQRMPDMTGLELLDVVSVKYPEVIKIILTGYSESETIIEAINKGNIFRYITKPWNAKELKQALEQAEELHSLKQNNKNLIASLNNKVAELEHTLDVFRRYVPDKILSKTIENGIEEELHEGEQTYATVLFCDIRRFTKICEGKSPTQIVNFLNHYYQQMSDCIIEYEGYVHQFVGDEIFATFGTPNYIPNPEHKAIQCAKEMIKRLENLSQKTNCTVEIGIGIHCGEVVSGNLGTKNKLAHSITGETVNVGKRLEHQTKDLPNSILISEQVKNKISSPAEVEFWKSTPLKGYSTPLNIYKVV